MLIGPVSRQFLGSTNRYLRPWQMYSGYGRNICDVKYYLTENKKDFVTKRSLIRAVGKRRSLLDYLKANDIVKYRSLISELGLRK